MPININACRYCLRYMGARTCTAFAGGIPDDIWEGRNDHCSPTDGDHGLIFKPLSPGYDHCSADQPALGEKGRFVTLGEGDDRRVIFIEGPAQGAGVAAAGETGEAPPAWQPVIEAREEELWELPENNRIEWAFAVDENGEVVLDIKGGDHTAIIPDNTDLSGAIFTHNHPSGQGFSPEDISTAVGQGVREMRAVGTFDGERRRHRVILDNFAPDTYNAVYQEYNQQTRLVRSKFLSAIRAGEMTVREAEGNHHVEVMTMLAKQFEYDYRRTGRGPRMTYIYESFPEEGASE
jgi:hypothetical protein